MTKYLRAAAALASSIIAFGLGCVGLFGQPNYDPVKDERRFTTLETKMEEVVNRLHAIEEAQDWGTKTNSAMFLMMAGLTGEAGIRIVRRRRQQNEED